MATLSERLAAKTDTSGAHHRWLGATAADGTPQIRVNGRLTTVRRGAAGQNPGSPPRAGPRGAPPPRPHPPRAPRRPRPPPPRRYHQLWRQWLSPTLTGLRPATLDVLDLEAALDTMANAGQSHSSIHQAAVLLSGALTWAQRQGQLKTNP